MPRTRFFILRMKVLKRSTTKLITSQHDFAAMPTMAQVAKTIILSRLEDQAFVL